MTDAFTSQVSQLLYRAIPDLNFAQIVGDLSQSFSVEPNKSPALAWDCDDIAVLDLHSARIVIGFSDNLPGPHAACVTIATGQSPLANAAVLSAADQHALNLSVAERIQSRFPNDELRTFNVDHALTSDLIDHVVDDLFQKVDAASHLSQPKEKLADEMPLQGAEASDMDRLIHRLSSELTARTPSLITRAIASATPIGRKSEGAVANAPKAKNGLFWRKGLPAPTPIEASVVTNRDTRTRGIISGELSAVRDALYASNTSLGTAAEGVAAQTKHTLMTLIALPQTFAMSIADRRNRDSRAKH